ncbi:MAG TPA: MBL fold metallo-hydrolase [Candidatus Saccharimonadales bacterium]|nr:MBL fold metallo-hydrolase [Candidatus Saccharimonadales bacterium]
MDLQFYGANCLSVTQKGARIIIDDNLAELGLKNITKPDDVALFTSHPQDVNARLIFDSPGEYEVSDVSVIGIAAQAHVDEPGKLNATIFKLVFSDQSILITGHIDPNLSDKQLEAIGHVDILVVPVGGNGYTVDATGALQIIKAIEPKLVIPTHYADKALKFPVPQQELAQVLKELAMEPKESVTKLRLKPHELTDVTQLVILERS